MRRFVVKRQLIGEDKLQGDDKPDKDKMNMDATAASATSSVTPVAFGARRVKPLAPDLQAQIGRRLMALYDDVLQQPVPDRFRQLLNELDQKTGLPEAKRGTDAGDST